jgi:hypothetical protein
MLQRESVSTRTTHFGCEVAATTSGTRLPKASFREAFWVVLAKWTTARTELRSTIEDLTDELGFPPWRSLPAEPADELVGFAKLIVAPYKPPASFAPQHSARGSVSPASRRAKFAGTAASVWPFLGRQHRYPDPIAFDFVPVRIEFRELPFRCPNPRKSSMRCRLPYAVPANSASASQICIFVELVLARCIGERLGVAMLRAPSDAISGPT